MSKKNYAISTTKTEQQEPIRVGFEFEARWPFSRRGRGDVKRRIVNALVAHFTDLNYTPEEIKVLKKITGMTDSSIEDARGKTSLEVITPPMTLEFAQKFLPDMLQWMQEIGVSVDASCGLHINMGFVNKEVAEKVDYLNLLANVDQDTVLQHFQRKQNSYCTPSEKVMNTLAKWRPKLNDYLQMQNEIEKEARTLKVTKITLDDDDKVSSKDLEHTSKFLKKHAEFIKLQKTLNQTFDRTNREHAIIDRKSNHGRYFEFRMTGNRHYLTKSAALIKIINHYQDAMRKSIRAPLLFQSPETTQLTVEIVKPMSKKAVLQKYLQP